MPKVFRVIFLFLSFFFFAALFPPRLRAAVSSCTASVSPSNVKRNVDFELNFNVSNTSSSTIVWVKFTTPSADNFSVGGGSASGWTSTVEMGTSNTYTDGSLAASANANFTVDGHSIDAEVASQNWLVQVSDDSNGANPTNCSGSLGVSVSGEGIPPTISNLSVSDVTSTSVKITLDTDELATCTVNYGATDAYGSSSSESTMATSHSLTLESLTANTTYHYKISCTDTNTNTAYTEDNTFVAAKASATATTTVTTTTMTTVTKTVADTTAPSGSITTTFSKSYPRAPTISGTASDNSGVARVEYSVDNGKNWLPVDSISSIGAKSVTFEFTPVGLDDGNFKIRIRITDSSGNKTTSKTYILVIDRLPPRLGVVLYSIGSQVLNPSKEGFLVTLPNLDQKITLSAVGGPIYTDLTLNGQTYSLIEDPDNGLWYGTVSFAKPGVYKILAKMIDGADNKIEKYLNQIMVLEKGKVLGNENGLSGATIALYVYDETTGRFSLWDAKPYGQDNPQKTEDDGSYKFILPPGKYFAEVKAKDYYTEKTEIFTLNETSPINFDFALQRVTKINLGFISLTLPRFSFSKLPVSFKGTMAVTGKSPFESFIGKTLPLLNFSDGEKTVNTYSFRGKPTVLAVSSSWLPITGDEIKVLEETIKDNQKINASLILTQESVPRTVMYKIRGGYTLPILSDPDGEIINSVKLSSFPSYLFLDRRGILKKIQMGNLTKEEILANLSN
jgi:hypothetical protein